MIYLSHEYWPFVCSLTSLGYSYITFWIPGLFYLRNIELWPRAWLQNGMCPPKGNIINRQKKTYIYSESCLIWHAMREKFSRCRIAHLRNMENGKMEGKQSRLIQCIGLHGLRIRQVLLYMHKKYNIPLKEVFCL